MQMLHDRNRDLYVVLTRFGRIGESGMNQRTPFTKFEDALEDFSTIFKQKTGNEWATAETDFEKKQKKYNLVQVKYTSVKHEDYLAPFDYEHCTKSDRLGRREENLVEEICNVTMYSKAVS
jgi:predicted DNA-binding WGR domain protein